MPWTTPGTATAGDVLTAAFWNTQVRDNMNMLAPFFGAWTSYTPQIDQGATTNIATSAKVGKYLKIGSLVIVQITATMNGAGTAGQAVLISLPAGITITTFGLNRMGSFHIYDLSTTTRYTGMCELNAGKVGAIGDWSAGAFWGTTPNLALAAGDQIDVTYISECSV